MPVKLVDKRSPESLDLILAAFIHSTDFISRSIAFIPDPTPYFDLALHKILVTVCLDHFQAYSSAPGELFQDAIKRADVPDDIQSELMEIFDRSELLSPDNVEYLVDKLESHIKKQQIRKKIDSVQALLWEDSIKEAESEIQLYQPVERVTSKSFDPFRNPDTMIEALHSNVEPLIVYPGALGQLINEHLVRDSFFAILAPEKVGKTYLMVEMAMRAFRSRRNVIMFQAGDLSRNQILRRLAVYITKKTNMKRYVGEQFIPVQDCLFNQDDTCGQEERRGTGKIDTLEMPVYELMSMYPKWRPCSACPKCVGSPWWRRTKVGLLNNADIINATSKMSLTTSGRSFQLSVHPSSTLSVKHIQTELDILERTDGFVPDVVVIDYADLLIPSSNGGADYRHTQDAIWKELRRLSQERHCLVITATQANASAYVQASLDMSNFSEDKRKLAHVTAMVGLQHTAKERQQGVARLNHIVVREGETVTGREVAILQALSQGRSYLGSFWVQQNIFVKKRKKS